jgi:predicted transcriptional regulator
MVADFLAKILRVDTQQKKEHSQEMNMGGLHHMHTCYQLSYLGELIVRKLQNKIVYYKETKILARKSGKGPLPDCKTEAKLEGCNQQGPLVRSKYSTQHQHLILTHPQRKRALNYTAELVFANVPIYVLCM